MWCILYLLMGYVFKWLVSQRPYLKQDHPIAPHVTAGAVSVGEHCLGRGPSYSRVGGVLAPALLPVHSTGIAKLGYLSLVDGR